MFSRRTLLTATASLAMLPLASPEARADFNAFVQNLWPDAQAAGVSRATFQSAMAGITPDPSVVKQTKAQSEFIRPIWDYIDGAVTGSRTSRGAQNANAYASVIANIEQRYGVPKTAFMGIWGMETSFGSFFGGNSVIRALATLAYVRYRDDFFRNELITALKILDEGHIDRGAMVGSWAGAMGHTQFMPSSFVKYAVDYDGDRHKNIWGSIPDALASTANYLKQHGWNAGMPWGVEVALPEGLDLKQALGQKSFAAFASLGIRRADGRGMPSLGQAWLFLPAGIKGPKFLLTDNFKVIKAYNSSDAYAMAVGVLGDVIYGGSGIRAAWPRGDKRLSKAEAVEVQKHLNQRGLYSGKYDGRFGELGRAGVTQFQVSAGLIPDGYATPTLLQKLRGR